MLERILPELGARVAAQLSRADIEAFRDRLASRYAGNSVANTIATLSNQQGLLVGDQGRKPRLSQPVAGVEKPRGESALDFFGAAEVGAIIAEATDRAATADGNTDAQVLPVAIALAVFCGLRKGEIGGLRWQDIHLEASRLDVMRSYRTLPKGGKPRHLPMHADLVRTLRAWRDRCPTTPEALVVPVRTDGKRGRFHMLESQDMLGLAAVLTACGFRVPARPWHSLRHYADLRVMPCRVLSVCFAEEDAKMHAA